MSLNDWKVNKRIADRISESIKHENISHAYLIEGDRCTDKMAFAKDFLKALNCMEKPAVGCDKCAECRKIDHENSDDLYIVRSDGKSVKDEMIFQLQSNLKKKPSGDYNMAIISDADTMTVRAQNRLLKTLEEPPGKTIIFLLSENRENLLETVRSRCVDYRLNGFENVQAQEEFALGSEIVDALLKKEKFFYIKNVVEKKIKSKEDAALLLDSMERTYRNFLLDKDPRADLIKKEDIFRYVSWIEEARRDLILNVKYVYAIKNLIIKIGG